MNIRHLGLVVLAGLFATAATAADLENEYVELTFGKKGEIVSLKDKASGRELVKKPVPFAEATLADGKKLTPAGFEAKAKGEGEEKSKAEDGEKAKAEDGEKVKVKGQGQQRTDKFLHSSPTTRHSSLTWFFPGGGKLELSVTPFDGGWTFTIAALTVKDLKTLDYLRVAPACAKYRGGLMHMLSDDADGVCTRGYGMRLEMPMDKWTEVLAIRAQATDDPVGFAAGLAAGPKAKMQKMMQGMTLAAGVPLTKCGGAWSLGNELNRGSYVFGYFEYQAIDEWIDLCRRGGFAMQHLHIWYKNQGHYPVSDAKYPGGLPGMKKAADELHAAGLRVSMHTLTANIDTADSWVTPVASPDLMAWTSYTLAAPLTKDSKEVLVNEKPIDGHDLVFTYSSRGNVLRIGGELVQYTGVRREKPYGFTGITRGAMKTKSFDHAAGEKCDYLKSRYFAFFPDPDSKTMDELAGCIAKVYNTCGIDRIYFDGAEGSGYGYAQTKTLQTIIEKLDQSKHPMAMECSCGTPQLWWYWATFGAWDAADMNPKRHVDMHHRHSGRTRESDLLEPQLGWFVARTQFPDDVVEYFAQRATEKDAAISLQGVNVNKGPLNVREEELVTILGWWERFRLARAFDIKSNARFFGQYKDTQLRQDADGVWQFTSVEPRKHCVGSAYQRKWTETLEKEATASLRIDALYNLEEYGNPGASKLLTAADLTNAVVKTSGKDVTAEIATVKDARRGDLVVFRARNAKTARTNAWARATVAWKFPYRDASPSHGIGLWVKGDGSGAMLDVCVRGAREFGNAQDDNAIRLDFEGWRYFEFHYEADRETDAFRGLKPFEFGWTSYNTGLRDNRIGAVELTLADLPRVDAASGNVFMDSNADTHGALAGGVEVALSEIRAMPRFAATFTEAAVGVNGKAIYVPFESVDSGDVITLEDGLWRQRDSKGVLKAQKRTGDEIRLKAGENKLAFKAECFDAAPRANVTFVVKGERAPALRADATAATCKGLEYEAMRPVEYCPAKGAVEMPPLKVRPGEKASLEVQLVGKATKPVLEVKRLFGWTRIELPDSDGVKKLRFKDTRLFDGVREMRFSCAEGEAADVRIDVIKHYER